MHIKEDAVRICGINMAVYSLDTLVIGTGCAG